MKTVPNEKSLSGSMVLVQGTHFLSKQIILHMGIRAMQLHRDNIKYSHAETLIWSEAKKTLFTVGARAEGMAISRAVDYYGSENILIRKPTRIITPNDNLKLWGYWSTIKNHRYQKANFISWIHYLKTGQWLGKDSDEKLYCNEAAARFSNVLSLWPKGKSMEVVSIFDLCENMGYADLTEEELDFILKVSNVIVEGR